MNGGNRRALLVPLAIAAFPAVARAHLNTTGMGPVYDGVVHLLGSAEDLVPVLGLALLAGLRGAGQGRTALLVLPAAWLAGGLAGAAASPTNGSPVLSALGFVVVGGLVAADAKLPPLATGALAAVLGLAHGFSNGSGLDRSGAAAVALVGLVAGVFVLVALVAALVVSLRAGWARIAVRVAGSWIAASGLLLLGWAVRSR